MAQGLLFLHKILNNISFTKLNVDFFISTETARKVYWNVGYVPVPKKSVMFQELCSMELLMGGPLSKILYWGCFGCPSDMGLMRSCKHVSALLLLLCFQYAFIPRTL